MKHVNATETSPAAAAHRRLVVCSSIQPNTALRLTPFFSPCDSGCCTHRPWISGLLYTVGYAASSLTSLAIFRSQSVPSPRDDNE